MKKIYFIILYFLISSNLFSRETILIIEPNNTSNEKILYISHAVRDIVSKHIFLYSSMNIISEQSDSLNYNEIKYYSPSMISDYKVDTVITYNVEAYLNGFSIKFFIYDKENESSWIEHEMFNEEENVFISINNLLDIIYKNNNENYINYDSYTSLIGYYSSIVNESIDIKSVYEYFISFYKDNIYFNIDYMNFLLEHAEKEKSVTILDEIKKEIKENHHYIAYINSYIYYNEYKENVLESNYLESIRFINKAIESRPNIYFYHNHLSDIYFIIGDYESAIESLRNSLRIYDKDKDTLKNLLYLLETTKNKPQ